MLKPLTNQYARSVQNHKHKVLEMRSILTFGAPHQLIVLAADANTSPSWMTALIIPNWIYFAPKMKLSKPTRTLWLGLRHNMVSILNACIPIAAVSSLVMNSLIIYNNKGLSAILPQLILLNITELLNPLIATCSSTHVRCYTNLNCPKTYGPKPSTMLFGLKTEPLQGH
jgi:hypothetical protein